MQKVLLLLLAILWFPRFSKAQDWKRENQRQEFSIGNGATNFLGAYARLREYGSWHQVGINHAENIFR